MLAITAGFAATSSTAVAEGSDQAQQKANVILAKVARVERQVAAAEQQYDTALAGVGASVNAAILDDRTSDASAAAAQAQQDQLDDRIRSLYMSGGPLAVYASLLDAKDPAALEEQAIVVQHVVAADQLMAQSASSTSSHAAAVAADAQRQAELRIATERNVAQIAVTVQTLLTQEQALLAQAQSKVAQIKAAEAALARQNTAFTVITADRIAAMKMLPAPLAYTRLYHRAAAAECPGLSWTILAAIGQVESGHGRNTSTSYAGAMGPMQFLPATFTAYAIDGDNDGVSDIMDPADAIFTAANYLCANGAATGPNALYNAIFHYNHADWYVQMVLALAKQYAG
jgi:hypothetical protein